jgi:SAM-dependent methyltransferase
LVLESFTNNFRGSALEIGCATAFGLSIFKSKGWDVLGLDPSKKAVEIAKKLYDIEVVEALFDVSLFRNRKFDLIILSHVLEHIISPDDLIRDLIEILEPNGLVYIEVPNMLKPEVQMGWFTFEHLNYFTPTALTNLMGVSSFELSKMKLFDGSMDIQPFYPVISALYKAKEKGGEYTIVNDIEKSLKAVREYIMSTNEEGRKINDKIESVLKKFRPSKVALWAAGIHTSQLLSLTRLSETSVGHIFDNDLKKHGQELCNI